MSFPLGVDRCFVLLAETYRDTDLAFPHLKSVTLAQWAMESGWGRHDLAQRHSNFAGMKWGKVDKEFGSPVMYSGSAYTSFTSPTMFIDGYWNRLRHAYPYKDWQGHTETPEAFIRYITPPWLSGRKTDGSLLSDERAYIKDILSICARRTDEFFLNAAIDKETDPNA